MNNKIIIIAEAGVNHNGDMNLAKKMIESAKDFGADIIKFQSYITENLVTHSTPKANYQKKNTSSNSQYEMLKKYELSENNHYELKDYCEKINCDVVGIVSRDGGYTAKKAYSCVKVPVISTDTITPHAEAWQAVIWHLIVTDPRIISYSNKWESIEKK